LSRQITEPYAAQIVLKEATELLKLSEKETHVGTKKNKLLLYKGNSLKSENKTPKHHKAALMRPKKDLKTSFIPLWKMAVMSLKNTALNLNKVFNLVFRH